MHPDLAESRLATLPVSLRRLTRIALAPSSTPETVSQTVYRILLDCQRARDNGLAAHNLLPLVNVMLDPADLPDPETALESGFRERVIAAGHALAILNCTGPRHASPALLEIAPRIWAWIRFMHNHEYFPGMELDYCLLLATFHPISYLDEGRNWLHTTPDICFFIGSTWDRIVSMCERGTLSLNDIRCRRAIHFLGIFLSNHISPQHSADLVDGAGGEKKLARLIVKYLGLVLKALEVEQEYDQKKALSLTLECTIAFTSHYVFVSRQTLVDAGLVRLVAQAALVFSGPGYVSGQRDPRRCIYLGVDVLASLLGGQQLAFWTQALENGLLRVIIIGAGMYPNDAQIMDAVEQLFNGIVTGIMQYGFLPVLASAIPKALAIPPSVDFMRSRCGNTWQSIVALAEKRMKSWERFNSTCVGIRSCENYDCNVLVAKKGTFLRCASCRVYFYCSPECQKISWQKYNHRYRCQFKDKHLMDTRGRRFNLMVILNDYQTRKSAIFLQKVEYINRTGNTNYCVLMKYVSGRCTPQVTASAEMEHSFSRHPCATRTAFGGRETHVVRSIPENTEFTVLLRCNTAVLLEGLMYIARRIPRGTDVSRLEAEFPELFHQLQALAAMQVVEIYS
ncbi:hypothetical protein R3P38DRAFT_2638697 [Favolaschia claudopus]|uniref:MYND-type domain-containing protein n=1 Tax=Favolaschia claudopus TaxID=2862362 RepID=A0AAW0APH0_9AGAR